jgi:flavin reductase (DIM6/NTAB) family NADH-FMN oxidoreductase RutF
VKKSLGAKTIVIPSPVFVIGTYDADGRANIMTASWGGICCSEPPCVAVSLRKGRYSFDGIVARKAFTVNVPSASQAREADYAGTYSGRDEDKFAALGLTAVRSELVDAPYVEQFPLNVECALKQTVEIGVHTQFIGEIMDVKIDAAALDEKGKPDVTKLAPFIYAPGEGGYWAVGELIGRSYKIGRKQTRGD